MKLFLSLSILVGCLLTYSCNNRNSGKPSREGCDSIAITKAILEKYNGSGFRDDSIYKELKQYFPKMVYAARPTPIPEKDARENHIAYLKSAAPIFDSNNDIVHFLKMNRTDLKTLYDNGPQGARLYFCNEADGSFNIILVPVNASYDNVLANAGRTTIVNKLDPCPPGACFGGAYSGTNNISDLNREYGKQRWYKPNLLDPVTSTKGNWWNQDNSATDN